MLVTRGEIYHKVFIISNYIWLLLNNIQIMSSLFKKIVVHSLKRRFEKNNKKLTAAAITKEFKNSKISFRHFVRDTFFVVLGVLSACLGLRGFLLPNGFIDGGVTGISLLVREVSGMPLSILIIVINLPFLVLGYSTIGKWFAIRSIGAIVLLAVAVHFLAFPVITEDRLLIAAFGGFFLGLGVGLAVRGGAVIDGTEVLAIYLSKKTHATIGDIIMVFNVVIFAVGAYKLGSEIALYAMLTYMVASKTVDFIIDGIEEYIGVTIMSSKSEEVRLSIIQNLERGCTIYSGKNGFAPQGAELKEFDIVYTVITRLEMAKLQTELDKVDENAFVIMNTVKDAKGGMIKKRPFKG